MKERTEQDLVHTFANQQSSRHTRRAYLRDLKALFGEMRVTPDVAADIHPSEVDALIRRGESDGLAESTLRRRLSAIRGFYDWLTSEDLVAQNPARHGSVRTPLNRPTAARNGNSEAQAQSPTRPLPREQAETLVSAVDESTPAGRRDLAILQLILHCALRRSEVVCVNTTDFRLVGAYWVMDIYRPAAGDQRHVSGESDGSGSSAAVFRCEQTVSGRAKVPDHVLGHVEAVRMDLGNGGGALFRSLSNQNRGARITGDAVYRIVKSAGEAANIEGLTPERLRQTGLHLAIRGGATVDQVRAHGRYRSADPFAEEGRREERLRNSAADYVGVGVELNP
jgi:site-specific recombinase XerD